MKIKHKKNKTHLLITAIALVLVLGIASASAYHVSKNDNTNSEPIPAETEDRPVGEIDYGTPSQDEQNPSIDSQENVSGQDSLIGVSITYAGGSPFQVRVLIDEILSTGNCSLVITKASEKIVSQTVATFATSSSTTCKGFTVTSPALNKGTYNIAITVESGSKKGTASKEVVVE